MPNSDNIEHDETEADFITRMLTDEENGEEFTVEYFKTRYLSSVGRSLYYGRRKVGLIQEQVAERMHTHQSAIARLEADRDGSISFHHYVEFAIACGYMPRSLVTDAPLESIQLLREELLEHVKLEQSEENFSPTPNGQFATLENAVNSPAASIGLFTSN